MFIDIVVGIATFMCGALVVIAGCLLVRFATDQVTRAAKPYIVPIPVEEENDANQGSSGAYTREAIEPS